MHLSSLLKEIVPGGLPDVEITGLTADSRQVVVGSLFVAVRGGTTDGHDYLPQAAASGASVLAGEAADPGLGIPYLQVADSRLFLALAAAAWHDHPGRRMITIGVTGTDGKTTTATLLHHVLEAAGRPTGLVTSVGARIGARQADTGFHVTTPDPPALQSFLAEMVRSGMTHAVIETTSHGLAQRRVAGCDFDFGVLTNITHEHLDYHGSFQDYLDAKAMLFSGLSGPTHKDMRIERAAILNRDDDSFEAIRDRTGVRVITYGRKPEAEVRAEEVFSGASGIAFALRGATYRLPVRVPVLGAYNVSNALAVAATAIGGFGLEPGFVAEAMASFVGVPGRMERIEIGQPFLALVDFAHTPNSLTRALEAARDLSRGKVIAVLGAAGLRDREKRPAMAEISIRRADITILTAEDPRTESLVAILSEMSEGAKRAGGVEGQTFWRIPDRGEAIRRAVSLAGEGDVVIACGKGHEQSMAFGSTEFPWDDRVALRAAISEGLGAPGPAMPILPTDAP